MRPAGPSREWRKARRRSWITTARRSRRPEVRQFSLPDFGVTRTEDEEYGFLTGLAGTIVAAEAGTTTELIRPDGQTAGWVVPA